MKFPFSSMFQHRDRHPFSFLTANVLTARDFSCLKKALAWDRDPLLEGDHFHEFQYLEDLNNRRLLDAAVIGGACCNGTPRIILEIGTSHGRTTGLIAQNAPEATVYTVNIPPEEIAQGGRNVTFAPSRDEIGSYYREKGLANVRQIFANTARWEPDFGPIDVAFIDGCHDADFVYHDTRKVLKRCRPGSIVIWHDFNPELAKVYGWINDVCTGVERLYADRLLTGRILHLQDSWTGLYLVPG
ncbi:class I SAM-dependent methyltransferase [Geomonas nitrogeniifigens]|uniref:Class I SAM-dependent methyltransferase n=1 Tax=Geomonas diazotrophica TaxID=2843197 RepID=A0ABX8JKY0_9BACT|nr:class I SAM-dependent methyltransferase [Geomonas nitrogeniifigens]QWV99035.1 class I SAM-dependent methyltransferase [Geomonas nitrogeniifigens]QXE88201.1 class I SAM-dependent methyltransferase [Geomonas nitrogeniifigens]